MTNPHRGEVAVTLDGVDWSMRPTFESLASIENRTGLGMVELAQRFSAGRFGVQDVTAIIHSGISAADPDAPDYEAVGRLVVKEGVQRLAEPVGAFLASALGVDEKKKESGKAGDTKAPDKGVKSRK